MRRHPDALILRRNWKDTRAYLNYCANVRQVSDGSLQTYHYHLVKLLDWARDAPFPQCYRLRPTFHYYLRDQSHAHSYLQKTCNCCRSFLTWAKAQWPQRYDSLTYDWIESLQAKHGPTFVQEREVYTLEDIRLLLETPTTRLIDERDKAMVAMMFLSGMRNGAFVSLPIQAVDLETSTGMLKQWPSLGVRTKKRKAANTYLLDIPDLQKIVRSWDKRVRRELKSTAPWYPNFYPQSDEFDTITQPGKHRTVNNRLKYLCDLADIDYKSSHKLRHGHAIWALERCRTMADLKAVSQNLMHSSLTTTDTIYAQLLTDDVAVHIANLSTAKPKANREDDIMRLAHELFQLVEHD